MDRPPEDRQPEGWLSEQFIQRHRSSSTESSLPAENPGEAKRSAQESGDALDAKQALDPKQSHPRAEQREAIEPDAASGKTGSTTDSPGLAESVAGGEDRQESIRGGARPMRWRQPLESIDIEEIDPSRTLIFHRFDPKTTGNPGPHFDTPAIEHDSAPVDRPQADGSQADEPRLETRDPQQTETMITPSPNVTSAHVTSAHVAAEHVAAEHVASEREDAEDVIELSADDIADDNEDPIAPTPSLARHRTHVRRGDSVRQSLVMLVTVFVMLAAARFILPGIVEEIRYAQHRGQLRAEFEVAGEGLKNVSLDTLSQAYEMVNAAAGPSVVHIDIHRTDPESIRHAEIPGAPSILISDQGSGVVVDREGYILTNRHVVAGSDGISVTLSDGRLVDAVVVGTDEMTDLAVLKVDCTGLIPIPWGDSERIRVGSPVWAIGSPFGLDRTVTFGILSGKHRVVRAKDRYQDFMQSDVAVNPGNSGGPLVDSRGTLIGINTAIVGDTYQGVSFAIPSGIAKKIYQQLREKGSIERGWLGVSLVEVPNERLQGQDHRMRGALIAALADRNSGAARAGLKPGDLVVQLDQERVRNVDHLMQMIGNAMAGTGIHLTVVRDDQSLEFDVLLGRRPDALDQR